MNQRSESRNSGLIAKLEHICKAIEEANSAGQYPALMISENGGHGIAPIREAITLLSETAFDKALDHIKIWTPNDRHPVITLEIPGRGFWSYRADNDDEDGGEFMLAFKEHFGIKGVK